MNLNLCLIFLDSHSTLNNINITATAIDIAAVIIRNSIFYAP